MVSPQIIKLEAEPHGFDLEVETLDPKMFESSLPIQHNHSFFEDQNKDLYLGLWDTTPMVEAAGPYPCDELMFLLQGEVIIKNNLSQQSQVVKAGETFVIPRGLDCQWIQQGYLKKYYVIYQPPITPQEEQALASQAQYLSKDQQGVILIGASQSDNIAASDQGIFSQCFETSKQQTNHRSGTNFIQVIQYENAQKDFYCGFCQSDQRSGQLQQRSEGIFILLKQGEITLTNNKTQETTVFAAREAFFLPQNTCLHWQLSDNCYFHFAVQNEKPATANGTIKIDLGATK